ncbi:hypothetical protein LCGC14_1847970 [marine sediment metagenome]|uniref:Uncharacterized protein n=1 Tax=marine sediment metagenome TaxID=412755 RepID=A0A0F9GBD0_9ZZZZ
MKTRTARRIAPHQATDGLKRNAGLRVGDGEEVDLEKAEALLRKKVILDGVSHPIYFDREMFTMPTDTTLYQMAMPRVGQVNEMAVFCDQIIDGPAYLRVYDQTGPVLSKANEEPVEVLLLNNEWAIVPAFKVRQGQRIRFNVDNVFTFPENMKPEDIALATGSPNLSLMGIWIVGMYFAKGGNSGAGQQPSRPTPPGAPGSVPELP